MDGRNTHYQDGSSVYRSELNTVCGGVQPLPKAECNDLTAKSPTYPKTVHQCFVNNQCKFDGILPDDPESQKYPRTHQEVLDLKIERDALVQNVNILQAMLGELKEAQSVLER